MVGVSLLVFSTETPLIYLLFPPLIWAALRFWQPGRGRHEPDRRGRRDRVHRGRQGPFAGQSPDDRLLLAQTFVGVAGVTALLLAAVITERRRVEDIVEYIADTLQESLLPSQPARDPGRSGGRGLPARERAARRGRRLLRPVPVRRRLLGGGRRRRVRQGRARRRGDRAGALHAARRRGAGEPARAACSSSSTTRFGASDRTSSARSRSRGSSRTAHGAPRRSSQRRPPAAAACCARRRRSSRSACTGRCSGVVQDPDLTDATVELRPGDALVLYTDGLTDAYAPERIVTPADLAAALERCHGRPAAEITRARRRSRCSATTASSRATTSRCWCCAIPPVAVRAEQEVLVRLPGDADAVPLARRAIGELEPALEPELVENLRLLVSELVTNSIRYAQHARLGVASSCTRCVFADRVRVEVDRPRARLRAAPATPESGQPVGLGPLPRRPARRPLGRQPRRRDRRLVRDRPRLAWRGVG